MKKLLLIACLSLAVLEIAGQTQNIDSLVNVLETQKLNTEEQLQILLKLGNWAIIQDDPRRLLFAEKGLELAKKVKDKLRMVEFNNLHGNYYLIAGDYDLAIKYFNTTLDLALEIKNPEWEVKGYGNIGVAYSNKGDIKSAIEYYKKAISCLERDGKEEDAALWLANTGAQYRLLGELDLAAQYLKKAESIAEKTNDQRALYRVYPALGNLFGAQKELDKAMEYGLKALKLAQEMQSKTGMANACQTLVVTSLDLQQYDEAEKYANECLRLAQEANNKRQTIIAWNALSNVYIEQCRYKETIDAANKVWEIDSTNLNLGMNAMYNITLSYIHLGNNDMADDYFKKFANMMSEINNKNIRENLMEMEVKYETEKKETRIASLEKERKLYVWLGFSGIFLAVLSGIVLKLTIRNARKRRQLVANESLQEGEIGERTRIAKDLHDRLGGSLSAVKIGLKNEESLQVINDKIDTCIKELRDIMNNIMPVSLQRHGMKGALEDFCVEFANLHFHFFGEVRRINLNQEYAIYCCARELVNNALKHAGATNINLQLIQSKTHLSLTVQDDGCGFDEKTILKGYGLENIRNRVTACRGKLDISSSPGKGTETVIELIC